MFQYDTGVELISKNGRRWGFGTLIFHALRRKWTMKPSTGVSRELLKRTELPKSVHYQHVMRQTLKEKHRIFETFLFFPETSAFQNVYCKNCCNFKLAKEWAWEFWFRTRELWLIGVKNGWDGKLPLTNPILPSVLISNRSCFLRAHSEKNMVI